MVVVVVDSSGHLLYCQLPSVIIGDSCWSERLMMFLLF